jgi:hypothetical protein
VKKVSVSVTVSAHRTAMDYWNIGNLSSFIPQPESQIGHRFVKNSKKKEPELGRGGVRARSYPYLFSSYRVLRFWV